MQSSIFRTVLLLSSFLNYGVSSAQTTPTPLEEIVVTGELIEQGVLKLPNSVTVIDAPRILDRSANHLEDLLAFAPNVNYASGASRGRFIQIRGIGERSEFQEPIINSVGVVLDGIDLTGIASAASSLDVKQVEVFRGPQGTLHGANALAGLINIVSNAPSRETQGRLSLGLESDSGRELSGAMGGALNESSAYRVALKSYQSDGYVENVFLGRDDTNNYDELTARARITSQVNQQLTIDASVFFADIDNGYDAFSLDNTRQTYSDQPGVDSQKTIAGSLRASYLLNEQFEVDALFSFADSELNYRYDEDWSNVGICDGTSCDSTLLGYDLFYSSQDEYLRDNKNNTIDLKLRSNGDQRNVWVLGLYNRDQEIGLNRAYTYAESDFSSNLETQNAAIYGQVDFSLNENWSLSTGLRAEQRKLEYKDNSGASVSTSEDLWGAKLALQYQLSSGGMFYGLLSRGYKPGGFNLDESISGPQREFDTETMTNFELGYKGKFLDDSLSIQATIFVQERSDIQTKQSIVASIANGEVGGSCPCSFTDFTDNAASGTNQGLELELNWVLGERAQVFASLGLLSAEFDQYLTFEHVDADKDAGIAYNLKGREQAHAPSTQWMIGASYQVLPTLTLSGSIEAKDEFFFSDRHEEKSDAYELLNLQLAYQIEQWQIALYAKNVTDEEVKTRGFGSFGNDPRKFYALEPYNQYAAPRIVGLKASLNF